MRDPITAIVLSAALAGLAAPGIARAEEPETRARREMQHLLAHLAASSCHFNRNGTWYDGAGAAAHLQRKHDYYLRRDDTPSAEEFIVRMASASSLSGQPYQVRCGDAPVQLSGDWFRAELARYRAAAAVAAAR